MGMRRGLPTVGHFNTEEQNSCTHNEDDVLQHFNIIKPTLAPALLKLAHHLPERLEQSAARSTEGQLQRVPALTLILFERALLA